MFDFPIHKHNIMSRASSRGLDLSDFSRNNENRSMRSVGSKIGNSPLTSKEFAINKAGLRDSRETSNTFADNYKNGLKPSERMKKFNVSQSPLINAEQSHHSMIKECSEAPNVNQNLRLLKTKMRLGNASSDGADPYINGESTIFTQKRMNSDNAYKNSFSKALNPNYEDRNGSDVKRIDNAYSFSVSKHKPIKADHQVLAPSKRFTMNKLRQGSKTTSVFTPKKATSLLNTNPYETKNKSFMRSTQKSGTGDDDNKYLTSEEIEKLSDPKGSLSQLVIDLSSKDWEVQVNACNVIRSIAIHDSNLLDSSVFRDVLSNLIKIAFSLRSSVCKNGLLVFQDIFQN